MRDIVALHTLVRQILEHPHDHDWSIQGFGLMRMYLPGNARLHIWDHSYATKNVSMMHDHLQWGLHSTIICGELVNTRYAESRDFGELYNFTRILAGVGGGPISEPGLIRLMKLPPEVYHAGDSYTQRPDEIHVTCASPGTVTVMQKYPTADGETARVVWPLGEQWGSAEPRPANAVEIEHFITAAKRKMEDALCLST